MGIAKIAEDDAQTGPFPGVLRIERNVRIEQRRLEAPGAALGARRTVPAVEGESGENQALLDAVRDCGGSGAGCGAIG